MRQFVPALLMHTLVPALLIGQQAASPARTPVTGRYDVQWGNGAGCVLKVQQLSDSLIRFQLDCSRGAPAYNTGRASDTLRLVEREAVYSTSEWGERCEIRFRFSTNAVVVAQTGSDGACGFGNGVYSGGRYRLMSREAPAFDDSP